MCTTCGYPVWSHLRSCPVGGRDAAERAFRKTAEATERACSTCGKMNDVGVAKCWWCEAIGAGL